MSFHPENIDSGPRVRARCAGLPDGSYESVRSALAALSFHTRELLGYLEAQHDALAAADMESARDAESGIARLSVAIVGFQDDVGELLADRSLEEYAAGVGSELGEALLKLQVEKKRHEWLCLKVLSRIGSLGLNRDVVFCRSA